MKVCERSVFRCAHRSTRLRPSTGKTKDGESVSGSINIPEVAHDTEENEFVVRLSPFFLHEEQ